MNMIFLAISKAIDAILGGNWALALTIVAVLLASIGWCVIWAYRSYGRAEVEATPVILVLLGIMALFIMKASIRDEMNHPERFVGHTYEVASNFICASASKEGLWEFKKAELEEENKPDYSGIHHIDSLLRLKCGIVNLADKGVQKTADSDNKQSGTRLSIIDSAKDNTKVPLVQAEVLNNAYTGRYFWLSAGDLINGHSVKIK